MIHSVSNPDFAKALGDIKRYANIERYDRAIEVAVQMVKQCRTPTFVPFLPGLFRLRGQPFSLDQHFQFEPLFASLLSRSILFKTGRQVGKSQSMCTSAAMRAALIPNYRIMFVTPLFTQVQRISNDVMRPLLQESPIGKLMSDTRVEASVLRRTFFNQSRIEFTFASLNADRARGSSNDELDIDELQDMRGEHIPILYETLSASKYAYVRKYGTPKTPENTIEGEWRISSQGVWMVPCPACKKENYACLSHDLERMIGPWRPDIGPDRPGTVCAKCSRPVFPHTGMWVHRYPERRVSHSGYHAPQPIMHLHYSNEAKWAELHRKREGVGFFTPTKYKNEVLGESAGEGLQLITQEQLVQACDSTRENHPKDARRDAVNLDQYKFKFLAVDWGGGGESGLSLTVPVVLGVKRNGIIEVVHATRLYTPNDHILEATQILRLFKLFDCRFMAHDFTGAGALRETIMVAAGVPKRCIIPIQYVGGGQASLMSKVTPTARSLRTYYRLNKSRSLLYLCAAVRQRKLRFFAYDYKSPDDPGLIHDFLALYEERIEHKSGSNVYLIARNQAQMDDFAQACNIGCAAIWYHTKSWPKFDIDPKYTETAEQLADLEPSRPWDEVDDQSNVLEDMMMGA